MMSISRKRVELIIVLLFLILLSIVWVWYGMKLKQIDQKKEDAHSLTEMNSIRMYENSYSL
jgi:uncharacterized membrane protein affecting hemolysin expression